MNEYQGNMKKTFHVLNSITNGVSELKNTCVQKIENLRGNTTTNKKEISSTFNKYFISNKLILYSNFLGIKVYLISKKRLTK